MTTIGIVSPGAMGSALGRVWKEGGARVVATVAGRSPRTRELAHGLELLEDLDAVVAASDVVISVLPPELAVRTATEIAKAAHRTGSQPVVADLNAIAPPTVARVAEALGDLELIDGAISGSPPPSGSTTVYLSGPQAHLLGDVSTPGLEVRVIGPETGTASAVKMCTASFYKGSSALLLQALQTAHHYSVVETVLADLGREPASAAAQLASGASKSDRFPGEMREIALAQGEAGAVPDLFTAMAAVWEAVHRTDLSTVTPEQAVQMTDLAEVLRRLS